MSPLRADPPPLNADFERRSFWQATMPALPDRVGRPLPDAVDAVVVGGGYTGLAAARRLALDGASVTLLEAERLGWGASTRNGGIVHTGYKWGPAELLRRHGEALGGALSRETLEAVDLVERLIADEGIEADWRRTGHVELAYAPDHLAGLAADRAAAARLGVEATLLPRERVRDEVGTDHYHGALVFAESGLLHPGRWLAGLAGAAERAGADLHELTRVRSIRRQADGRFVVETSRGALLAREVVAATNGYTDGGLPGLRRRVIPIGSYMVATEPLPDALVRDLAPRGRGCFDTKHFLYYWQVTPDRRLLFGGRASFLPTTVERTAAILRRGLAEVFPQLVETRIEYAWGGRLGFTMDRMPHVGRLGGVAYAMGYCGSGVALSTYLGTRLAAWLGGGEPPALARLPFRPVPAPYEGRPWFLPLVGEYYRFRDRLASSRRRSRSRSTSASVER